MALTLPIPFGDPAIAFAPWAGEPGALLLDSAAAQGPQGRTSYVMRRPENWLELVDGTLRLDGRQLASADLFAALDGLVGQGGAPGPVPFTGGWAGFLGYELAGQVERLPGLKAVPPGHKDMALGRYSMVAAYDHERRQAWIIAPDDRAGQAAAWAAQLAEPQEVSHACPKLDWRPELSRSEYLSGVAHIIDYIRAGDVFQANFTQRFLSSRPADLEPFAAYLRLRALSPAPFAAFFNLGGGHAIASASPERFIRLDADGTLETRPIKGTRPRRADAAADAREAAELAASIKDRAENLMITDLLRNDLGRAAELGSVRVPVLAGVESFASVHHLVSVVTARLRAGLGPVDVLRAAFPGGSITGAPKVRAMEIIAELEPAPRGPYCGSVLWMGDDGAMDSSIIIRTLVFTPDSVIAQAGGGIVADSLPEAEYEEMMTKVAPLLKVFQ